MAATAPPPPTLKTILIESLSPQAVLFSYNQPHLSNAFTLQSYHDLRTALLWSLSLPTLHTILISGQGRHFCAGKLMSPPTTGGPTIDEEILAGSALASVLQSFPKILVAAVHGAAIGWGCTQLWNFDLVYAHAGAFFQTPFVRLGFTPEGGSSWSFPRVMGKFRANRLLLAGDRVSAREMERMGFVSQVLGKEEEDDDDDGEGGGAGTVEEFHERVREIAKRIGGYDGESLRMTKALVCRPSVVAEQREAGLREAADLRVRLKDPETMRKIAAFGEAKRKRASRM